MAGFGTSQLSSENEAFMKFEEGFGKIGVGHEETYYPGLRAGHKACNESLIKLGKKFEEVATLTKAPSISTTSGGTYTGYGLMTPYVDPSIVDRTVRETPLVKLLPRKAVKGRSYVYNLISAKAGAAFLGDDAALSDQVDTRSTTTVAMKYLYAVGRVTGPSLASGQGFINLMAEDIRVKTASMNEKLENEIVNGDTTVDSLGFNGLIASLTTNTTNNSGAEITLEQIRDDINTAFEANGLIDLVVVDGNTLNHIKGLLMTFQRNVERPSEDMQFGIPDSFMFDGALFIKDRYMPTTATSRRAIYLDTRYVYLAVLQDYTYFELAKTNDSDKYAIKWYGALVVTFESAMVMRYGLA